MNCYLAPMEGVTGRIFRTTYHACFPSMDKYFAPFITPADDGRISSRDYKELDPEYNQGLVLIPQILTDQAEGFIRTAKSLKAMGFTEINLNLGCPSGTVVSKKRGSGFLAYPQKLDRFLHEIFSRLDMRISIKTRLGKVSEAEFPVLLEIYNRYPLEELIIHPRLREDFYKGLPRMEGFEEGYSHSRNPVCYNGDIFTAADYHCLAEKYPSLDRVMLGRGIAANPGLLEEIRTGVPITKKRFREFHDRLYEEYQSCFLSISGQRVVLFKMKELWSYMTALFPDGRRWEKKIKKAQSLEDYEMAVDGLLRETEL